MLWTVLFIVFALWLVKLVPVSLLIGVLIGVLIMMGIVAVIEGVIKLKPRKTLYVPE